MERNTALYTAVLEGDRIATRDRLRAALDAGGEPSALLNGSMIPAMQELGERFERHEVLLPDLLVGARAMQAALDILEPLFAGGRAPRRARVCIGSVKGDHHDIGKNIVAMMVRAAGYEIQDLGSNCEVARFADAVAAGARAVLCSCLTARCADYARTVAEHFSNGAKVPVIVGGAAMNEAYARAIGARAYGATANDAVRILNAIFPEAR